LLIEAAMKKIVTLTFILCFAPPIDFLLCRILS